MANGLQKIAFGPVPSRRLGRSLGVNNIPPKICSYSCVYCQLGRTRRFRADRGRFYTPEEVFRDVAGKVRLARERAEPPDYLTFVPDGEPTLDEDLEEEIRLLKGLGIRIAVISNASLMWDEEVQRALSGADWVSLKVDAASDDIWRRINRPHRKLERAKIMRGVRRFSDIFRGRLVTETMLVGGLNDGPEELKRIASFITEVGPARSYLSIPIRPPAESWVRPPMEDAVNRAFHIFREGGLDVECLTGYEGNAFVSTGKIEEDMLRITSVHPMRKDGVQRLLKGAQAGWDVIEKMLQEGVLVESSYRGHRFYMRRFRRPGRGRKRA